MQRAYCGFCNPTSGRDHNKWEKDWGGCNPDLWKACANVRLLVQACKWERITWGKVGWDGSDGSEDGGKVGRYEEKHGGKVA